MTPGSQSAIERIRRNVGLVEDRILAACHRAGRRRSEVLLLAVVKQRPLDEVREIHDLGYRDLAESRVQELRTRVPQLPESIRWHLVGHLQTNKAKYLPGLVEMVHSVDRAEAADALEKAWERHPERPPLRVLLQFNISGEEQKHGAGEQEAIKLLRHTTMLSRLQVEGLMCMAPLTDNPGDARPVFRNLRRLRDRLEAESGVLLPHLSMGMTNDFEWAIEEGATIVRIGTALFDDVQP